MLLCIDVGNTHILGGVFRGDDLVLRFRHATHPIGTADQFGLFLRGILSANGLDPAACTGVAACSVVPGVNYTVRHAFSLYFRQAPFFDLKAGAKTGLNIRYKNPAEVGADRIANAIGGVAAFPGQNLVIIDMGTATTFCALRGNGDYLGGVILPGMRVAMESLRGNTARLMDVDIEPQDSFLGRTTRESIQKGLFFGQRAALREITQGLKDEEFGEEPVTVLGTGGFSQMFREAGVFDAILPDLVLQGLKAAHAMARD